jgi:hypothetical protein
MTRVTPSQLPHLSFPSSDRYTPLRPIGDSAATATAKRGETSRRTGVVGTGNVVVLLDSKDGEEATGEYVELDKGLWPAPTVAEPEVAGGVVGTGDEAMAVEEDEAEMPAPFEVSLVRGLCWMIADDASTRSKSR